MTSLKDWRTRTFATVVVLAFLAGAWVVAVPNKAPSAAVGGIGSAGLGTRDPGQAPKPVTSAQELSEEMSQARANLVSTLQQEAKSSPAASLPDGFIPPTSLADAGAKTPSGAFLSAPGEEGPKSNPIGTRGDQGLTVNLASVDAGGPYGPVDEGTALTVTATQSGSPPLVMIRWDLNGDGKWEQTPTFNPATKWSTDWSFPWTFNDDFYGNAITVEAWDGVSFTTVTNSGNIIGTRSPPYYGLVYGTYNLGNRFQATQSYTITALRAYRWSAYSFNPDMIGLWSDTGTLLRSCVLPTVNTAWNTCAVTPYPMTAGTFFRIGIRNNGYWMGDISAITNPMVSFSGLYYQYSSAFVFPLYLLGNYPVWADFVWSQTLVLPNTVKDTAFLDVRNVAPDIISLSGSPDPVAEGAVFTLSGTFTDPGLDDAWDYQIDWGDGTVSPWTPISKWNIVGTAKVLVLHAFGEAYGYFTQGDKDDFKNACGSMCTVDFWDFGPGGTGVPPLSELLKYDVVTTAVLFLVPIATMTLIGNRLADYEDLGGGVVHMDASDWGTCAAAICGRWRTQSYGSFKMAANVYGAVSLGTRNSPGSFLLDGISTVTAVNHQAFTGTTTDGENIADWTGGDIAIGYKSNPIVANNACAVGLNFFPNTYYIRLVGIPTGGDWLKLWRNSVAWCAHLAVPLTQPIPFSGTHVYVDDDPTGTNQDKYDVTVRVRDDDHGKLRGGSMTWREDFNTGVFAFPGTWTKSPTPGAWGNYFQNGFFPGSQPTQGPSIVYFDCLPYYSFNFGAYIPCTAPNYQYLRSPTIDLTMVDPTADIVDIRFEIQEYWQSADPAGFQNGWVEMSTDNFATTTEILRHENKNPGFLTGINQYPIPASFAGTTPRLQLRAEMYDDIWWVNNYVAIRATWGTLVDGLAEEVMDPVVKNVKPVAIGGALSSIEPEAATHTFAGYQIFDPAQNQLSEQFAYRWDFDDGSGTPWVYKGTLAIQLKVLIIHTFCGGAPYNGCAEYNDVANAFQAISPSVTVTGWNFVQQPVTAPSLAYMMTFDLVFVSLLYAYFGYAPFETARLVIGNNLADYMDLTGNGVITHGGVFSIDSGYPYWNLAGRYINDDYGAFESAARVNFYASTTLGQIFDPSHLVMKNVASLTENFYTVKNPLTAGGGG